MLIGMNAVSTLLFYIFYHPPSFAMKHDNARKWEFVKNFDYFGTFLVILGMMLVLMGLSWGGQIYAWKSAHVLATIVVGFVLLCAFFAWEKFVNPVEPLVPLSLFKNRGWVITTLLWGTGSALYYANAILWPSMVAVLYSPGHGWVRNGFLASVPGAAIVLGEFTSPLFKKYTNVQLMILFPIAGILEACKSNPLDDTLLRKANHESGLALSTPDTLVRSTCLMFFASYAIGICEMIQSIVSSISIDDQREIGTAVGTAGGVRQLFSCIGGTIFTAVLANKLGSNIPARVPAALLEAGLSEADIPAFIAAVSVNPSSVFTALPGVTSSIAAAGLRAYQDAAASSYSTVFLVTIYLSVISSLLAIWAPNVNHLLTSNVNVHISEGKGSGKPIGERSDDSSEIEEV